MLRHLYHMWQYYYVPITVNTDILDIHKKFHLLPKSNEIPSEYHHYNIQQEVLGRTNRLLSLIRHGPH
jgi:hypothetical protein